MDTRRDFLKKAALLAAGGSLSATWSASIQRALAIDPPQGSSYLDAEHVVILMQENRSFDHTFGTLRGVRGFNDPRAVTLPNGNPVWLQSNAAGKTFAPFRLNIKDTRATWMSSLPHTWPDQVDARNQGRHDGWLDAKRSGNAAYADMPLTLGYYSREDLPFYYALADAFTICDQNFCSSLTGTTPNRLYLWSGTIRDRPSIRAKANVRNSDVDYGSEASWKTFPERLEEAGVDWRVYQNELSLPTGLEGEGDAWLANFTDNPLEWFTQYHVRFSAAHQRFLAEQGRAEPKQWNEAAFAKLSPREQQLHRRAFTTNRGDPNYHALTVLSYKDGATPRQMKVPKGDVLHQFRQDVREGKLPTVSWIVAPENFSDHPGAPWFGAWYVSEVIDILTHNPDVWKKTIFVLCYDENDGYFDHVPPFVAPHPERPETGKASAALDTATEQVTADQENSLGAEGRTGPIGLGFRVPLLVASPWSRGGYVCSQVFDHTSIVQLLETILTHKTGKPIREENISAWRRAVCGDLSAAFRPYQGEKIEAPQAVDWNSFAPSIHQAKFKGVPTGYKEFTPNEIRQVRGEPRASELLAKQEPGLRPSCALPYELSVDGSLNPDRKAFSIRFLAGQKQFGTRSAGAPFHVYTPAPIRPPGKPHGNFARGRTWAYAVAAGELLTDQWALADFDGGKYHLCVHGPNGFFREFKGSAADPGLEVALDSVLSPVPGRPGALLRLKNVGPSALAVGLQDLSYGAPVQTVTLGPAGSSNAATTIESSFAASHGWYDLALRVSGAPDFAIRYAGRIETGQESLCDPNLGLAQPAKEAKRTSGAG